MEGEREERQSSTYIVKSMSLKPHLFCRFQSRMGCARGGCVNTLSEYSRYPISPKGGVSSTIGLDGRPSLDDLRIVGMVSLPLTTRVN